MRLPAGAELSGACVNVLHRGPGPSIVADREIRARLNKFGRNSFTASSSAQTIEPQTQTIQQHRGYVADEPVYVVGLIRLKVALRCIGMGSQ